MCISESGHVNLCGYGSSQDGSSETSDEGLLEESIEVSEEMDWFYITSLNYSYLSGTELHTSCTIMRESTWNYLVVSG